MKFKFKIWLETDDGKPVIGKGGISLMKNIIETGSISTAAKKMHVSYKFAWEYVRKVNDILGGIEMHKGGKGAGGTIVSEKVTELIKVYEEAEKEINEVLEKYNKKIEEILKK
ncbi:MULTISPECIES: winged helix-turn-helix domain-containing protein [Sulfurisphaera]|uniref:Uncharacterized protein n=3 Tax=Sulfurisphaera TaxID=69655 RepID=Q973T9_SULTO|nr:MULTISPECIES: winged helix-turn-helix domain-containing protein [Sulfurisphaera]MBB5254381.1 molybdate transport system regulatory protein [Sulfurisphaera ohwakuensis]QGR16465.1 LysR family transcriptional regulator [Sulfurisphaera ohwakuensis]BAB65821.1 hypothetical protein STK_08080 [Sulfurisphaera tokodaii str. 7]HII74379.1 LysR family transcriptional regulator [Sulfurisphaera tokodaii]